MIEVRQVDQGDVAGSLILDFIVQFVDNAIVVGINLKIDSRTAQVWVSALMSACLLVWYAVLVVVLAGAVCCGVADVAVAVAVGPVGDAIAVVVFVLWICGVYDPPG